MNFKLNIWYLPPIIVGLFVLYFIGGLLYFNATPKDLLVTEPISVEASVEDDEFIRESGLLLGTQWIDGNEIEILDDGELIFERMLSAIRNAEQTITKETYNYWGDEIGTAFAEELANAARRGVEVYFLMDFVGSRKATRSQLNLMEEAGVHLIRWRQPSWFQLSRFNHRTHRKLMVIDGKTAFTGGVNTADDWLINEGEERFRDYHYKITGPVVNEIQKAFSENWVAASGRLITNNQFFPEIEPVGDYLMQVTSSHPREGQMMMRKMYLYAITSAQKNIRLNSAYFFPDQPFLEELAEAANRGVKVQMIVPGENIDQAYFRYASKNRWGKLLEAGVEIYEYQPSMYHAKLLIVDDKFVSVGSANIDNRSFRINDETNVNILNREFAEKRIQYFEEDLQNSELYTLEKLDDRSNWQKFAGWAAQVLGPHL